uniref:Brain tumor protein n=1 Tax=Macrostomum lignano TaxID=282301 RepID=A0A1I8H072_9PLAT
RSASLQRLGLADRANSRVSNPIPNSQLLHRSRSNSSCSSSIAESSATAVSFQQQQQQQANQLSKSLGRLTVSTSSTTTSGLLEDNTEIFLVENLTPLSVLQESSVNNHKDSNNGQKVYNRQLRQTGKPSGSASMNSLQELLGSDLLLCRKCKQIADKPVLLPCLDTLCTGCFESCAKDGDRRCCPACNHPLHQSTAEARSNWFLASLTSVKLCQEEGAKQVCDYCRYEERQVQAAGLCIDCSDFLCSACSAAHGKTKMTRHHNVMSFDDLATGQSDELIRQHQTFECPDHPNEKVSRYCATCDQLICRECREQGGERHAKHQVFSIDEFGSKTRDSLMGMIDNVRAKVPRLTEYGQFLDEYRLSVEQIVDECRDALLRQLNESVAKETEDVARKEEKLSDIKSSIISGCVFADALVTHGSAVFNPGISPERSLPILFGKLNLAHHPLMKEATGSATSQGMGAAAAASGGIFSPNVTSVRLSSGHQQAAGGSVAMATKSAAAVNGLGSGVASMLPQGVRPLTEPAVLLSRAQLVLEFEAKSPLDTRDIWPTGLAISETTGDYFVLDRDNKCVKSFDRQGRYRMEFGCPGSGDGSLSSPYDLAILEERLILVTDYQHEAIKAYSMQGKYLTTYRGPFKHPRGIAAMRGRQFVVADCRMRQLTVHDGDSGNLVRTIRSEGLFTDPYYVAVTHDDVIVVTDWAAPNLKLFDFQGNLIGQAGSYGNGNDQVLQPYGVASDTSGQVMVADNSNHRIHLLGSDGRFVKFVVSKFDGLWHPMAIAVTPEGYLAVTEALGKVKVFKYM